MEKRSGSEWEKQSSAFSPSGSSRWSLAVPHSYSSQKPDCVTKPETKECWRLGSKVGSRYFCNDCKGKHVTVERPAFESKAELKVEIKEEVLEGSRCEICLETRIGRRMFKQETCSHLFCTDCISKYVADKPENNLIHVLCPHLHCKSEITPTSCQQFMPKSVHERWEMAITKSLFSESQKFYCPFKDCSAMLINDNGGEVIRESECPHCHRLFCAECKVPWHSGMKCREFQEVQSNREDRVLEKLALEKSWKRCPQCQFYVEKAGGCVHMVCRCTFEFCYRCGNKWTRDHGAC